MTTERVVEEASLRDLAHVGLGLAVVVILWLPGRVRTEERNLIERFGASYRDYQLRTGRFLPRLGRR